MVVKGKTITTKTLHKLPDELNVFNITSRSNDTTLGFFGELNPLSNFHPAPFVYNDVHYTTSEQFTQHQKSLYFGDHQTATQIITTESPADCKAIGNDIMNFNQDRWDTVAKEICKPGIRQKFKQQPALMDVLINCTQNKEIVECATDKIWGTGYALSKPDCLDRSRWTSPGILGEILTEICEEEARSRLYPEASNSITEDPTETMSAPPNSMETT